jgi:hypothetical protein
MYIQHGGFLMPRKRSIADRERDAQALQLRARGLTHRHIAAQLGWKSPASAVAACDRALGDTFREDVSKWRDLQVDKLDDMTRVVWQGMAKPHYLVSQGKAVRDDITGELLEDHTRNWEGVDRLVKIEERRARLLGLDAPQRTKVEVQDGVDAEIERLVAELASLGETPARGEAEATRPPNS